VCDNVISTVRFSLFKLVKFSFFSYLLLVFITPVNKDYQKEEELFQYGGLLFHAAGTGFVR